MNVKISSSVGVLGFNAGLLTGEREHAFSRRISQRQQQKSAKINLFPWAIPM
ncbi:MAG: hypothetical protein IT343_22055 [Candidatus Melainabacteria bacterium]|nr:hypothetical protein [Candidatus Melainabacteria bacterium]